MRAYLKEHPDKYIHLHADCLPVPGALNTAIYDLTRGEMLVFPTEYIEVLNLFKANTLRQLLDLTDTEEERENFLDFVDYLLENEMIIFRKDTSSFLPVPEGWEYPGRIQNAIIDVEHRLHDFGLIIDQLHDLGCNILQVRSFGSLLSPRECKALLKHCYNTSIQGVELILKYDAAVADDYKPLLEEEIIISALTIHSAPEDREEIITYGYLEELASQVHRTLVYTTEVVSSHHHCGIINSGTLVSPTVAVVMENKLYNGCLNRKISIDRDGLIRNCPSMPGHYGLHDQIKLKDVVRKATFTEKEHISKDQISICRDCEYRYVCTDCRAYLKEPENIHSKPLKCGYNPYTGEWEDWTQNPISQEAIRFYEFNDQK